MGCPKIVPKGNLSEMVSNWQISIGYEANQIMTPICVPVGLTRKICPISLPLREIDAWVGGRSFLALLDSGSSIVGIHEEVAKKLGLQYDVSSQLVMEDVNGGDASILGLCRELPIHIDQFTYHVQGHVVNPAPYEILLG